MGCLKIRLILPQHAEKGDHRPGCWRVDHRVTIPGSRRRLAPFTARLCVPSSPLIADARPTLQLVIVERESATASGKNQQPGGDQLMLLPSFSNNAGWTDRSWTAVARHLLSTSAGLPVQSNVLRARPLFKQLDFDQLDRNQDARTILCIKHSHLVASAQKHHLIGESRRTG
jgi:hypothetical protein